MVVDPGNRPEWKKDGFLAGLATASLVYAVASVLPWGIVAGCLELFIRVARPEDKGFAKHALLALREIEKLVYDANPLIAHRANRDLSELPPPDDVLGDM